MCHSGQQAVLSAGQRVHWQQLNLQAATAHANHHAQKTFSTDQAAHKVSLVRCTAVIYQLQQFTGFLGLMVGGRVCGNRDGRWETQWRRRRGNPEFGASVGQLSPLGWQRSIPLHTQGAAKSLLRCVLTGTTSEGRGHVDQVSGQTRPVPKSMRLASHYGDYCTCAHSFMHTSIHANDNAGVSTARITKHT